MDRDTLILQNLDKATRIARAFFMPGVDADDLRQEAHLEVIAAASRIAEHGCNVAPDSEIARRVKSRLGKLCGSRGRHAFLPIPSVPYEEAGLC